MDIVDCRYLLTDKYMAQRGPYRQLDQRAALTAHRAIAWAFLLPVGGSTATCTLKVTGASPRPVTKAALPPVVVVILIYPVVSGVSVNFGLHPEWLVKPQRKRAGGDQRVAHAATQDEPLLGGDSNVRAQP